MPRLLYSQRNSPQYQLDRRLGGPQSLSRHNNEDEDDIIAGEEYKLRSSSLRYFLQFSIPSSIQVHTFSTKINHGIKITLNTLLYKNLMGRDLDCMADVLMEFHRSTFSKPNTEFNSDLAPMRFLGFSNREKGAPRQERSAARFREVGGAL
jgi:hypothetical protein